MRYVLVILLVAVRIIAGCPEWLAAGESPLLLRALSYPLFHANWFHLAANCLAIYTIFRRPSFRQLAIGYIISTLVFPLAFRPVVGISNLLYAVLGLRTPPLRSRWWKMTPVITFHVVTVLMLLVPQFSAVTHIMSYTAGIGIAALTRKCHGSVR